MELIGPYGAGRELSRDHFRFAQQSPQQAQDVSLELSSAQATNTFISMRKFTTRPLRRVEAMRLHDTEHRKS